MRGFANLVGNQPGTRCDTHTSIRDDICVSSFNFRIRSFGTWPGPKPRGQDSEASEPGVPMAMDADDDAGTVAYNIPDIFQSLIPQCQ
jgi:hypothetical protein